MELSFLRDIIKENWFQEVSASLTPEWTFHNDLLQLDDEKFRAVIILCLESMAVKVDSVSISDELLSRVRQGISHKVSETIISLDLLVKILTCMTISEYRLDALTLHSPEMRGKELDEISVGIGLGKEAILEIDRNWHEKLREKVFPQHLP